VKKTLALTVILKNEINHLPRFWENVKDCFDAFYFTDTGSTDGSFEWLTKLMCDDKRVSIHQFDWVDDFSAARNYNLKFIKEDYWAWLDLDDAISDKESFLHWKNELMPFNDMWYAPYNYALDKEGRPACSFTRERVMKTSLEYTFNYFIHEGVSPKTTANGQVTSWAVNHLRTNDDFAKDKGRNIRIMEQRKDQFDARMWFYMGKEYFDSQQPEKALDALTRAIEDEKLSLWDRILAMQYLCHTLNILQRFDDCIKYGTIALQLDPMRAEYWCLVGDAYGMSNRSNISLPFYRAARSCPNVGKDGRSHSFAFGECYDIYPRIQSAKILFHSLRFEEAIEELGSLDVEEANALRAEAKRAIEKTTIKTGLPQGEDVVITCLPNSPYPWDEDLYKTKGIGGSETAAVEIAKWIKKLTNRKVKIFNHRETAYLSESGVEYLPIGGIHDYFAVNRPKLHVGWRHAERMSESPTITWGHDAITAGLENGNFGKIMVLSESQKRFTKSMVNVPDDKFIITRNGLNPERFKDLKIEKQSCKVIWPNSPDRGLEYAIKIMERVREAGLPAELHCFYGFGNMKMVPHLKDKAEMLEKMISERPWIKYVGNVDQARLAKEFASSEVWLYPANFIETYCISALEALACKCYPVVRKYGALQDTLKDAAQKGWASMIDCHFEDDSYIDLFAKEVIEAIEFKKYNEIDLNLEENSWAETARQWIKEFDL